MKMKGEHMKRRVALVAMMCMFIMASMPVMAMEDYMNVDAISTVYKQPVDEIKATMAWYIVGSNVNLRLSPSLSGTSMGYVQQGNSFRHIFTTQGDDGSGYWRYCQMTSGPWSGYYGYVQQKNTAYELLY